MFESVKQDVLINKKATLCRKLQREESNFQVLCTTTAAWLGWPSLNLCSSIQRWLVCMFESHSMSNLEPIIRSIIYLENDTLVHINLAIVISRQKLSLSLARASTLSSSEYGLSFSLCLVSYAQSQRSESRVCKIEKSSQNKTQYICTRIVLQSSGFFELYTVSFRI